MSNMIQTGKVVAKSFSGNLTMSKNVCMGKGLTFGTTFIVTWSFAVLC